MRLSGMFPLAVLLTMIFAAQPAMAQDSKGFDVGDKVADFKATSLSGKEITFVKDILDPSKLNMLFFMTTACSACFQELSDVHEFVSKAPGKLNVWAVAVDLRGKKTVKPYSDTYKFNVSYIIDPRFKLPRLFGFSYTPSFALIDGAGKVIYKKGGFTAGENIKHIIEKFVK